MPLGVLSRDREIGARCLGALDRSRVDVDAGDPAPRGAQQLDGDLPDEAESDDDDRLADSYVGLPHTLHRDGADGRVCGVVERDAVRDRRAEVSGNEEHLGVRRISRAGACDAVAGPEIRDAVADRRDDARRAVAERFERLEPRAHLLHRRRDALAPEVVDDLFDEIGALTRLPDERALSDRDRPALGARADQRASRADENAPGPQRGRGNLADAELAGLEVLNDLFHRKAARSGLKGLILPASIRCGVRDGSSGGPCAPGAA